MWSKRAHSFPALAAATLVAAALVGPRTSAAQEPPTKQQIQAVERGFFIESDVGFTAILNKIDGDKYGLGTVTAVYAGYDVLPIFSIVFGFQAIAVSASDKNPRPGGDLFYIAPMVHAQFAVLTTERNFLWLRAGAGFGFALPKDLEGGEHGGAGVIASATAGYERYTKLRHFSVGVHGGVLVVTKPGIGIGLSVVPTLKYTF